MAPLLRSPPATFPAISRPDHYSHTPLLAHFNSSVGPRGVRRPCRCSSAAGEVDAFTKNSGYLFELSAFEADSLSDYDISKIYAIYQRKPLILLRRLLQIGTTFGKWLALRYIDTVMERSDQMFKVRAAELRQILVEFGPSLRARTEKALIGKQIYDSDSKVVIKQILSFTLTEKGAFVREILLEEFAKGLDALGLATVDSLTSSASTMTEEDRINLRTLRRLMHLLSGAPKYESSNVGVNGVNAFKEINSADESQRLYQLASVQEFLPALSVLSELPPESQQQILLLPTDLAGRLISRAAARTLRRFFL